MPNDRVQIRPIRENDFAQAAAVADAAFCGVIESLYQRKVEPPFFSSLMYRYRSTADPAGCHVAVIDGEVVGVNFSIARGTLAWFGPLAVRPDSQGRGIAQRLVKECMRVWEERGVRLMGLETFPISSLHINLYANLGFRPAWTGIAFTRELGATRRRSEVTVDGPIPNLDYLYPGFDLSLEVSAIRATKVGVTLTSGGGVAVCHLENTLWIDGRMAYVPIVIAPDRETFDRLMDAVEDVAARAGKSALRTQVPGSAWETQRALLARGFKTGTASLRMKRGEHLDYDGGSALYCDDWH